jgi:hypothetical protein
LCRCQKELRKLLRQHNSKEKKIRRRRRSIEDRYQYRLFFYITDTFRSTDINFEVFNPSKGNISSHLLALLSNSHGSLNYTALTLTERSYSSNLFVTKLIFNTLTFVVIYLPTTRSRVIFEKLTGLQLVKKFPAFYGTRRFLTAFTSAHHLSLF